MKKYLEKAKQVGLSVWGKVKNLSNSLWNFTLKHVNCVYTAAVVSLVFGMLLFFSKLDHAKQVKAMEKETLILVSEFEITIKEHEEVIDFQAEINQKLGQELNQAGMLIQMQKDVIRQLVLELQKAGIIPMPPPESKNDPRLAI